MGALRCVAGTGVPHSGAGATFPASVQPCACALGPFGVLHQEGGNGFVGGPILSSSQRQWGACARPATGTRVLQFGKWERCF